MEAGVITLIRGKNEANDTEFYFTELVSYDNFDIVVNAIKNIGLILINNYDGIYSRAAQFQSNGKGFEILYHEDVGIYAVSNNQLDTDWLNKVLIDIIDIINAENNISQ